MWPITAFPATANTGFLKDTGNVTVRCVVLYPPCLVTNRYSVAATSVIATIVK